MNRRQLLKSAGAAVIGSSMLPFLRSTAFAASNDTVVVMIGNTINSLDIHRPGTNRPSYQVAVNVYDRLVTFGTRKLSDGSLAYDYDKVEPELAESWTLAPDRKSITFKLKPTATFWDGTPVTAEDVKWSFERALALGGFPKVQMGAGGFVNPAQFVAVDARTFRIDLKRPSKLSLPNLGVPVAVIINSKVARSKATAADPWAAEYLHRTPAGSGAYKVERWDAGQQLVYARNDKWVGGPLPAARRVIIREVPAQATRRALVERGDAHLSFQISNKDARELAVNNKVKVTGSPIDNCLYVACLNYNFEPFKDQRVRQAVAWAIPYDQIFKQAAYGRGVPMWGAKSPKPATAAWPQPFPYGTDLVKARALLDQTAHKGGFEVPLSYDLGEADWGEPAALLIQESLGKLGIKVTLDKVPGANWRTVALVEKKLPFLLENFGGWLNTPCYYFYWAYIKGNLFNASNYDDAEVKKLIDETLHMEKSEPAYEAKIRRLIQKAFDDVPRIPLWQPTLESAMIPRLQGYQYWFHRQVDARFYKLA
ncbi:MAG: transporter extracellular solute-binding protein [Burkholderiales bacterium]|nr:transporter extracellular solute-binding protein [Burkholderiales bacterium]